MSNEHETCVSLNVPWMAILRPDLRLTSLTRLPSFFPLLKQLGINAVVLDKDNCLTLPDQFSIHPSIEEVVPQILANFQCAILSNSAGSFKDAGMHQANKLEQALQIPVIRHNSMKPLCFPRVCQHFLPLVPTRPLKIAVVGDRLLTDVLMGNIASCYTVLVEPLDSKLDSPSVRFLRSIEGWLLKYASRN